MATSSTAAQFKIDLQKAFQTEVQDVLVLITKKIAMEALRRIVLKSPVDTGRFRGNWSVSYGVPTAGKDTKDKPGQETINRGTVVISKSDAKQIIWVSNHLPYAERLENGYSKQAPAGVVAITFAELQVMVTPAAEVAK